MVEIEGWTRCDIEECSEVAIGSFDMCVDHRDNFHTFREKSLDIDIAKKAITRNIKIAWYVGGVLTPLALYVCGLILYNTSR